MERWFPRWLLGLLPLGGAVIIAFVVTAVLTSTPPSGVLNTHTPRCSKPTAS